jgi:adenine-specific DNA-methyltransferase
MLPARLRSGGRAPQIGDENVHRVRALLDEIFGSENFLDLITFRTGSGFAARFIKTTSDYVLWYVRQADMAKFRRLFSQKRFGADTYFDKAQTMRGAIADMKNGLDISANETVPIALRPLVSSYSENTNYTYQFNSKLYYCGKLDVGRACLRAWIG